MNVQEFYEARIAALQKDIKMLRKRKRNFGIGRLVSFLSAIILFFALLELNGLLAVTIAIVLLLAFIFITKKDIDNIHKLRFKESLQEINENEVKALHHDLNAFDDGSRFKDNAHPYSNDLDIFGRHGLFQLINRTTGASSAALLAERLLYPLEKNKLLSIQESVKELQPEAAWRQELAAKGLESPMTDAIRHQMISWATYKEDHSVLKKLLQTLAIILPLITLSFIILAYFKLLPWKILWLSLGYHLLLLWQIDKVVVPAYNYLSESIKSIDSFYKCLKWITGKIFLSPYLHALQQNCVHENEEAYQLLDNLKKVLHRLEFRLNPFVHFSLDLCIFWEWYQYRQLLSWKEKHAENLLQWVNAFAEIEVLSSFANMAFNHPDWCYPEITDQHFMLSAKALGHPLLPDDKRICNDVNFSDTGKIMLVTGSNMAGKSTFLRAVGVNMILAMAGSSVCAKEMSVSTVKIISSMRIADNLEENISTFYAELKKLEFILQKVRAHEKVFLLLDEILRGTNSQDRHTGAKALIKQFLHEEAVGILATHDLELTGMESEYKNQILNYHFDVEVQDQELYFDYKLKPGICTSMNASLLMRKIGIEV